jgi:protocatechuate 3,4-dioxygenase beta subunit
VLVGALCLAAAAAVWLGILGQEAERSPTDLGGPAREGGDRAAVRLEGRAKPPPVEPVEAAPPAKEVPREAGLRVRLLGPRGEALPVPAEVSVRDPAGRRVQRTLAPGAEGVFEGLAPGTAEVDVQAPDHCLSYDLTVDLVAGEDNVLEARLEAGTFVEGRVVRARDGSPVSDAVVDVRGGGAIDGMSSSGGRPSYGVVRTDRDGRFRTRGLPFGFIVTLAVEARGFRRAERALLLHPVEGERSPLEIRLDAGGRLSGTVRDPDGDLVTDALVTLGPEGDESWHDDPTVEGFMDPSTEPLRRVRSDAEGRFVLEGLAFDVRHCVVAVAPGHARSRPTCGLVATERTPEITADVVLLRPGRVVVRALDPDGRPPSSGSAQLGAEWGPEVALDAEGRVEFAAVAPGERVLRVRVPGFVPAQAVLRVGEGDVVEHVVHLDPGVALSGVVVDDLGQPVAGATVTAQREGPEGGTAGGAESDSQGRFRIGGLERGEYRLHAGSSRRAGRQQGPVVAPHDGVRIVMERYARVSARFVPVPGAEAPPRIQVGQHDLERRGWSASRDWEEGRVVWDVQAGRRLVQAHADGYAPWEQVVEVAPGEERDLGEIRLERGETVRGQVVDARGTPVAGATLEAQHAFGPTGQTDAEGRFRLEHLRPEPVQVHVRAEGFVSQSVAATPGRDASDLRIVLLRGARVLVRLSGSDGVRLPDLVVRLATIEDMEDQTGRWAWEDSDSRGEARALLLPGRYRLEIGEPGDVRATAEVLLEDEREAVVEIVVPRR